MLPHDGEVPVVLVSGKEVIGPCWMAKSDHCIGALSDDKYVLLNCKAWVPAPAEVTIVTISRGCMPAMVVEKQESEAISVQVIDLQSLGSA
jgi:pyruvate/2-oxoglutarate/acetoin dehydrogenase E1 component